MSGLLTAIEKALSSREAEREQAVQNYRLQRDPRSGSVTQQRLADILSLELTPEEKGAYWDAKAELARIDGQLGKVGPSAAKGRIVDAKARVAAGDTDPELVASIGNLRAAKADDAAKRRSLKAARLAVEAKTSKALLPVADRARIAIVQLLSELESAEQAAAERFGLAWIPSATAIAVREAKVPTDRCVEAGRAGLEYIEAITTEAARGPKPSKPSAK